MTYYILLNDNEDLWDENILGEESFGKFYTGNGFIALNNMIQKEPEALSDVKIVDERGSKYSITEFLDTIKKFEIILDN